MPGHLPRLHRLLAQTPAVLVLLGILGLVALSLTPLLDRALAGYQARQQVTAAREAVRADPSTRPGEGRHAASRSDLDVAALLRLRSTRPTLVSWGNIGGCGAGGGAGSATAGGVKWIGRGVTGGLVDLQCMASQAYARGSWFSTFNTRVGTGVFLKWNLGLNLPVLYKRGGVEVPTATLGVFEDKIAQIAGFGDLSLEVTRKLGITNATTAMVSLNLPTGSHDARRQGVLLPPQLQLGSGVLGATAQVEHTMDRDWGLIVFGGALTYAGWENRIGGFRGSSALAYGHVGMMLGPVVPSFGLTVMGKVQHDRKHDPDAPVEEKRSVALPGEDDPLLLVSPALSLEWSSDLIAILLNLGPSFSYNGAESLSISLGLQTSLF